MKKDIKTFLKHILENIKEIESYINGITEKEFIKNRMMQNALVRCFEIIGEASRNLPAQFKNKYPQINWREIIGMRDIIVHEYFDVDLAVVWDTIKNDIPILKKQIQEILEELEN